MKLKAHHIVQNRTWAQLKVRLAFLSGTWKGVNVDDGAQSGRLFDDDVDAEEGHAERRTQHGHQFVDRVGFDGRRPRPATALVVVEDAQQRHRVRFRDVVAVEEDGRSHCRRPTSTQTKNRHHQVLNWITNHWWWPYDQLRVGLFL